MIEEAEKGNLKALYVLGENPLRSLPQSERVRRALANLEFLVVQDILENETTQIADVVLPGAAFSEKGGSFTNLEGRIQSFLPAAAPPGEAKPDWEVLDLLAQKMGSPKRYGTLEKIRTEISRFIPLYGEQAWTEESGSVTEQSPRRFFRSDDTGTLIPFAPAPLPEAEAPSEPDRFTAIIGSRRFHLGSGTRTGYSERIGAFDGGGKLEISPRDAETLDMDEGDTIRISSEHGSLVREIRLSKGLKPGIIFVPIAVNDNDAMNLVDLTPLGEADSPGWKTCRVGLEKV
jgi:formate dehydrogenase alpha subunit